MQIIYYYTIYLNYSNLPKSFSLTNFITQFFLSIVFHATLLDGTRKKPPNYKSLKEFLL